MGYRDGATIPPYRTITPLLLADGRTLREMFSKLSIPWTSLPDFIQEELNDTLDLADGVAMLEEKAAAADARGDHIVKIALPMSAHIGRLMSNGDIYYDRIYWAVATSVFHGVLDEVRTTAVSVLAEVRSGIPATNAATGTVAEVADQAVQVIVYDGRRNTFNINTNQAKDGGTINVPQPGDQGGSLRWTKRQTYWTIVGVILAIVTAGLTFYFT